MTIGCKTQRPHFPLQWRFEPLDVLEVQAQVFRDLFDQEVSEENAKYLGPYIEVASRFPNRTNVQFLEVIDHNNIRIEIWERGAGYTLASGSSSSAAAAVAKKLGLCDSNITVHMPGGTLELSFDEDYSVTMTGPVVAVGDGTIREECLKQDIP